MNIRSRITQLEKQEQAKGNREHVKAQLEKILYLAKTTPRQKLKANSIYCLPPEQSNASEIFMSLFKEYGVTIE